MSEDMANPPAPAPEATRESWPRRPRFIKKRGLRITFWAASAVAVIALCVLGWWIPHQMQKAHNEALFQQALSWSESQRQFNFEPSSGPGGNVDFGVDMDHVSSFAFPACETDQFVPPSAFVPFGLALKQVNGVNTANPLGLHVDQFGASPHFEITVTVNLARALPVKQVEPIALQALTAYQRNEPAGCNR